MKKESIIKKLKNGNMVTINLKNYRSISIFPNKNEYRADLKEFTNGDYQLITSFSSVKDDELEKYIDTLLFLFKNDIK